MTLRAHKSHLRMFRGDFILSKVLISAATLLLVASAAHASAVCDKTQQQYRDCIRLVDSLRPEKPGQMRVFAADGSEFNGGQVQWMKAQLRRYEKLCARGAPGDEAEAARILAGVEEMLSSHRRAS
jgi:hypothetical protein